MAKAAATHVDRLEQVAVNVRCDLGFPHEKNGGCKAPFFHWTGSMNYRDMVSALYAGKAIERLPVNGSEYTLEALRKRLDVRRIPALRTTSTTSCGQGDTGYRISDRAGHSGLPTSTCKPLK